MEKVTLKVDGMSCEHCVKAVNSALGELAGVKSVNVDLKGKSVSFEYDQALTPLDNIKEAITEEGFTVL
jgi:copper chaperone